MTELQNALSDAGFESVRTYIQSGNVVFTSTESDESKLAKHLEKIIKESFSLDVAVTVFSASDWKTVIKSAPKWWGADESWKHNILVMIGDHDMAKVMKDIGELKPDIEKSVAGKRVVYQSLSWENFGRTTGGKLASRAVYQQLTIRNYNTATKLLNLLTEGARKNT